MSFMFLEFVSCSRSQMLKKNPFKRARYTIEKSLALNDMFLIKEYIYFSIDNRKHTDSSTNRIEMIR